jgi:uncharacterized protein involved in propanediol utilization
VVGRSERREYRALLDRLATALGTGDLATIGEVATRSAELNQAQCAKRHLNRMVEICREIGALGVAVAHSGTMVGILVAGTDPRHAGKVADVMAACAGLPGTVSIDYTLGEVSAAKLAGLSETRDGMSYVD